MQTDAHSGGLSWVCAEGWLGRSGFWTLQVSERWTQEGGRRWGISPSIDLCAQVFGRAWLVWPLVMRRRLELASCVLRSDSRGSFRRLVVCHMCSDVFSLTIDLDGLPTRALPAAGHAHAARWYARLEMARGDRAVDALTGPTSSRCQSHIDRFQQGRRWCTAGADEEWRRAVIGVAAGGRRASEDLPAAGDVFQERARSWRRGDLAVEGV